MYITEHEKIKNLIQTDKFKDISMERLKFLDKRVYVTTKPFAVYSGLTSALESATFKGNKGAKRLGKWRDKMRAELGVEGQEAYLNTMADFGTLCHEALVRIKQNGGLDWKEEKEYAHQFFIESAKANGINPNFNVIRSQVYEYCKTASALLQFVYDNVIEIYGIETMAKCDQLMIGTPIDIICKVRYKKQEVTTTINLKTSEQFSSHHWEQVAIERYLWNATYPDFQAEKTGLLRGKDWNVKKVPTYEFELMDEIEEMKVRDDACKRLELCLNNPECTYMNFPTELPSFDGITKAGEAPVIITETFEQIYNRFVQEKLAKEMEEA